MQNNLCQCKTL